MMTLDLAEEVTRASCETGLAEAAIWRWLEGLRLRRRRERLAAVRLLYLTRTYDWAPQEVVDALAQAPISSGK